MGARNRWQLAFDFEEQELDRCATIIRADLGITVPVTYTDALYLAEIHGGAPVPCLHPKGECLGETIRVSPALPDGLAITVILHELVHRLANGPRYECLNPVLTCEPRREWIERLARRIAGPLDD